MKKVPEGLHSQEALCVTTFDLIPAEFLELPSFLFWNHWVLEFGRNFHLPWLMHREVDGGKFLIPQYGGEVCSWQHKLKV